MTRQRSDVPVRNRNIAARATVFSANETTPEPMRTNALIQVESMVRPNKLSTQSSATEPAALSVAPTIKASAKRAAANRSRAFRRK